MSHPKVPRSAKANGVASSLTVVFPADPTIYGEEPVFAAHRLIWQVCLVLGRMVRTLAGNETVAAVTFVFAITFGRPQQCVLVLPSRPLISLDAEMATWC
jgi:hypothetical protein